MKKIAVLALVGMTLSGSSQFLGNTGPHSHLVEAAVVGGVAGAIVGGIATGTAAGVVVGAGIGAAAGAAIAAAGTQ